MVFTDQSDVGVSYAHKILKEEAIIEWQLDAKTIDRKIRALNPAPGAMTHLHEVIYKLWFSEDISDAWENKTTGSPGQVLAISEEGIDIACGSGVIRIFEMQKAGSKTMSAKQFKQSNGITAGQQFN
jgi:methionyl-tRNA formyltransferase